jgi:hypothetical protein
MLTEKQMRHDSCAAGTGAPQIESFHRPGEAMGNTAVTTVTISDYLHELQSTVAQVQAANPVQTSELHVAGRSIRLRFAGEVLVPAIWPALAHLAVAAETAQTPSITFDLWDTATTGVVPPRPPFDPADYRRYGQRAVAYDDSIAIMHTPDGETLCAYDKATRHGIFWTADAGRLSIYERAAPLQTLFHWAMAEFGWQIIHAAVVGTPRGGVLLVGNTGAGKSTTALSCLRQEGLQLLCDDKCLVRLKPVPEAFALFSSGKVKADMLERMPHLRSQVVGWDDSYKAGKGLVFLYPTYADRMVQMLPLKAIVLPAVAHRAEATILPATSASAFRQLGPSTVIWLPGAEVENYRFTAELTRHLPCYRFELATDLQRNAETLVRLLAELEDS